MSSYLKERELIEAFTSIAVWKSQGERAPHKPLLLLMAIGQLILGNYEIHFETFEPKLRRLLEDFASPRKHQHPEYPFIRLSNDGIWEIESNEKLDTKSDYSVTKLIKMNTIGRIKPNIIRHLERVLITEQTTATHR